MKDTFRITRNIKVLLLGILCFSVQFVVFSQDSDEKHRTYLGLEYRQVDGQKNLIASLTARVEGKRGRQQIADKDIGFYLAGDTSEILLGRSVTNADGKALFQIENSRLPLSGNSTFTFIAVFDGDKKYQETTKEVGIKSLNMEINFIEIDSVKNIEVTASFMDQDGNQLPVEEDVALYVPGQFSRLKIGEIELEEGEGMVEFPVTLPGDSIGNLRIIAVVEESDNFGTVEITTVKDWGKPRLPVVVETRRGLGDTDAPLWMVYTLIVLMSAVWFHYLYLFVMMYMIKQKGKSA